MQTENEAAMQQIKRLKIEHAHASTRLAEENTRMQRMLAQVQVHQSAPHVVCIVSVSSCAYARVLHVLSHSSVSRVTLNPRSQLKMHQ